MSKEYHSFVELLKDAHRRLDQIERDILMINEVCARIEHQQLVKHVK
ncbi:hypothetical protein [Sporolactobacillus terrae]|uniref:Uncharacterized protein n=1 Tax=Sporolactobacillus terrae TaxID=269673 RepID=A0A5K7X064_9BACL|nr:hypothetical protein [Sporolactobacillus terrae]UAK17803.1 hypothetical protein K7399_07815 [Sporolactobacillus terrae]BBN99354.1 hypothetical protein St703_20590 [Sporolactobacillus terrae]